MCMVGCVYYTRSALVVIVENGLFNGPRHEDLTTSTRPEGPSVHRLIESIDRRVDLPLRKVPLWGSQGRWYSDEFFAVGMESF